MGFVELHDVTVAYRPGEWILNGLNLSVERGELVSLLGPSGCGKTTTLRVIAGFVGLERGRVVIGGRDYTRVPPNRRNIGLVFQSYALFPHLTVFENVAFGLRLRRMPPEEIRARVHEALRMVGLVGFEQRLPAQLSGGQQQRVAVARAIVIQPQLLLLDEPLSNLDAKLRVEMRSELRRVQRQLGVTMIYVTHDQAEAMALSDRVVVMNAGRIEQVGTPEDVWRRPCSLFVADFMGFSNRLRGVVESVRDQQAVVAHGAGRLVAWSPAKLAEGRSVVVVFRPDAVQLRPPGGGPAIPGRIVMRTFQGSSVHYVVETGVGDLTAVVDAAEAAWREGDAVELLPADDACIAFEEGASAA